MPDTHLRKQLIRGAGLFVSLEQLLMANEDWKTGSYRRRAVFHLFFRGAPSGGQCAIAAGLELAADAMQQPPFDDVAGIQYLGGLKGAGGNQLFGESFLNYLQRLEFRCDVDAMAEGEVFFPFQPIMRIEGPLLQCRILETAVRRLAGFSSLAATLAARAAAAANGEAVLESGSQNAWGTDGAMAASRAACIGGCQASSNLLAGRFFGIPVGAAAGYGRVLSFGEEALVPAADYHLASIQLENGEWENFSPFGGAPYRASRPTALQVQRIFGGGGRPLADVLFNMEDGPPAGQFRPGPEQALKPVPEGLAEYLLRPVFRDGQLLRPHPALAEARQYSLARQALFGPGLPQDYPHGPSEKLALQWAGPG